MKLTLHDLARQLGCRLLNENSTVVSGVSSLHSARPDNLVFIEDRKHLDNALNSSAAAVIAGEFAANVSTAKPILICSQPRLTFARAAKLLCNLDGKTGIHSSAIVAKSAQFGENVTIGAGVIVGENARIGDGTRIGPSCVIGDEIKVGSNCRLDANVTIYFGTTLGDRVIVQAGTVLGSEGFGYVRDEATGRYEQFPQIGTLVIEDDVEIGANSTIDRGALDETRICRGTKIDNLVHVGHNVRIGHDVVIAAQTGLSGSAAIDDNVIIGGQVGIADHVRVEDGAILGAQCGVPTKKVIRGKGVVFWGTPARPIREYLKELAYLSRLAKKG